MGRKKLTQKWIFIGILSTIFLASDFLLSAQSVNASKLNLSYSIGISSGHSNGVLLIGNRHNRHGFNRHNRHGFNRHNRHGFNRHNRHGFNRHNRHGFNRHNRHGFNRHNRNLRSSFRLGLHFGHGHGPIVSLPHFSTAIFVGGHRYYHNHGTYYKRSSCGYYAVPNPYENYYSTKIESTEYEGDLQNRSESSFVVNIPNSDSGYTEVLIKKSGDGYIGPQGEYYQNFPSVDQLKAMYSK